MTNDPETHHRRSIRLKDYDYRTPGLYFVTIVVQDRACLFGDVVDGVMYLNDAGRMVERSWAEMPRFYPGLDIDSFTVMPNHIHGIIALLDEGDRRAESSVGAEPPVSALVLVRALVRECCRVPTPCEFPWATWYVGSKP